MKRCQMIIFLFVPGLKYLFLFKNVPLLKLIFSTPRSKCEKSCLHRCANTKVADQPVLTRHTISAFVIGL